MPATDIDFVPYIVPHITPDCVKWEGRQLRWSGTSPPPPYRARVHCSYYDLGWGNVVGYFQSSGFLGVIVCLEHPPPWHVLQNKNRFFEGHALVFGAEIE